MKRFKRMVALFLVLAMSISLAACATDEPSSSDATTDANGENNQNGGEATAPPVTVTGNIDADDAFVVYCWNGDVQKNVLAYFNKAYPEYADRIVYVDTGGTDYYQGKIDELLKNPEAKEYPDLIAMEMDYMMKYTDSEETLPMSELGITEDDMKNMYDYTVQAATVDGKVKGLSWQATPGALMYRRSLAKKYLGVEEPNEVQEYFKDWNTILETGKKILKESDGKTKLFSGIDDVKRVYQAARKNAWYDENYKISVDQTMVNYLDYAKQLYDLGLTNNTTQWSDPWSANMSRDNTFAYFGCTWFLHWSLKTNCGGTAVGEGTYGDWAMCAGPQPYYWGGTWLGATKGCSDKELAGKIIKAATCETDVMKEICKGSLDYVNNKEAIKQLGEEGVGEYDFLGGQDFIKYFSPLAEEIKLPAMCAEDSYITNEFDAQVTEYSQGNKDKDTTISDFKRRVLDLYPYITE